MSTLLEALKKASEEKKRKSSAINEAEASGDVSEKSGTKPASNLHLGQQEEVPVDKGLSSNSAAVSAKPAVKKMPVFTLNEPKESLIAKNSQSEKQTPSSKSSDSGDLNNSPSSFKNLTLSGTSSAEPSIDSPVGSALNHKSDETITFSLQEPLVAEVAKDSIELTADSETSLNTSASDSLNPSSELQLSIKEPEPEPEPEPKSEIEITPNNIKSEVNESEPKGKQTQEQQKAEEVEALSAIAEIEAATAELTEVTSQKSTPPTSQDELEKNGESFDWSLDKIPAYANQSDIKSKEKRAAENQQDAQEVVKAINSQPSKVKRRYSKSVFLLSFLLLVSTVALSGLYLMSYYQDEEVQSQRSLRRYNLPVEKMPSVKPPVAQINPTETEVLPKSMKRVQSEANEPSKAVENQVVASKDKTTHKTPEQVVLAGMEKNAPVAKKVVRKPVLHPSSPSHKTTKKVVSPHLPQPKLDKLEPKSNPVRNLSVISTPSIEKQSYEAYLNHDYVAAKKGYKQVLATNPDSISALFGLGAIAMQQGETNKALSYYNRAARVDPHNPQVKKALAVVNASRQSTPDYESNLQSLLAESPNDAALNYSMGNVYAKQNDWVEAQRYYFKAASINPNDFNMVLNLAISLDHLGEYELAEKNYLKAIALPLPQSAQNKLKIAKNRALALRVFLSQGGR